MIPMMLFDASSSNDANDANDANGANDANVLLLIRWVTQPRRYQFESRRPTAPRRRLPFKEAAVV